MQAEVGKVEAGDFGNDISGARTEGQTGAGREGGFLGEAEVGGGGYGEGVGGVPGELGAGRGKLRREVGVEKGVNGGDES